MRKERTRQDTIMSQLAANIDHINNGFGSQNVGVIMGMLGIQYSGSYGENVFVLAVHVLRRSITTQLFNFRLHILI